MKLIFKLKIRKLFKVIFSINFFEIKKKDKSKYQTLNILNSTNISLKLVDNIL